MPVEVAPGGMRTCSSLPGKARGLKRFSHASSTSHGCRVSHAALPATSPPGRRQAGQGLKQGSIPLLAPFPCSLHSPGSLEEPMSEEEGAEREPSVGRDRVWLFKAQHDAAGLVGPSRLEGIPRGSLEIASGRNVPSLPEDRQPFAGNGGTAFPMPLFPSPSSPQLCSAPQESQPRRAAAAVNRPILMHITPNITTGGTRPFPLQPSQAISCETQPPLALQLPARKPAWAASPSAMPLASAVSPRLGEAVGLVQQGSAFRQQSG